MKSVLFITMIFVFTLDCQAQTRRAAHSQNNRASQTALRRNHSESAAGDRTTSLIQSLPVRRVILYSNGVAYIERRGKVTGHAEISFSFKQSQVDDVLKSMIVLDLGQGRIGAVSYNSSAPPAARLADIPFSIESGTDGDRNGGLAGVLRQLQGARVVVAAGNRVATGSILTVEERKSQIDANKPAVITHALVIASDGGELTSFDLAEVRSVKLSDEGARRDVSEFASASASARRRDAKTIVVTSDGTGTREMLVSYTIAAPIWKTTYRVVLDQAGKPFFQGWAIVDNVGDEDWNGISLSLVSGTPISFIQPIQKPFYRYRPVVPIPGDLKLEPQVYEQGEGGMSSLSGVIRDANGAVISGASVSITNVGNGQSFAVTTDGEGRYRSPVLAPGNYTLSVFSAGFKRTTVTNLGINGALGSNYDLTLEVGNVSETVTVSSSAGFLRNNINQRQILNLPMNGRAVSGMLDMSPGSSASGEAEASLSEAITGPDSGVQAAATGGEVGDLFEYKIDQPVTVPHDRSALIPILQTRMDGERVSIYNEATRRDRPMGGMLLKNTSSLTLEDGSMTIIDGDAYAGEALMERIKPGEQRLISFALDLGTLVTARLKEDRTPTFQVRVINGVFQAHYHQTTKKVYTLTNQTDKPRVVVIEHPVRAYWKLTDDTQKPDGTTARFYRFRVSLKPHESIELPVTERREVMDSYALTNFTRPQLELFVARNYIDSQTQVVLEKILGIKGRIATTQSQLLAIQNESSEITQDQQRLRENIKALTSTVEAKQLISRYVNKADTQESRLEQLEKDRRSLVDEQSRLQVELDSAVRGLALDRKLTE